MGSDDAKGGGVERRRESQKDSNGSSPARGSQETWAARGEGTARNGKDTPSVHKVFLGGLPFDSSEAQIQHVFEEFGEVIDTKILYDRNGAQKGCAFVTFTTAEVFPLPYLPAS